MYETPGQGVIFENKSCLRHPHLQQVVGPLAPMLSRSLMKADPVALTLQSPVGRGYHLKRRSPGTRIPANSDIFPEEVNLSSC